MTARSALLPAALLAVVLIGCGGGDGDDGASGATAKGSPLTRAEFVRQANAACAKERAGLRQRVAQFERRRAGRPPTPGADMVHFIFLPTIERQIFRMEELDLPPSEVPRVDALLDAQRFGVDAVAVIPRVPSIAAAAKHFHKADRLLHAYGLDSCVIGGR
jgi:hypothetical protein